MLLTDYMRKPLAMQQTIPVAAVTTGVLVLVLFAGAWLWHERARTFEAGERSSRILVRVLKEQTSRSFEAVDLTLLAMIDLLTLSPALADHDADFEATLRGRSQRLPQVRALFVIGPDGFIAQDSDHPNTPRVSLADRDYFRAHQSDPTLEARIGQPLISRSVGRWFVSMTRRFNRPDGSFGGVAVAAIEPIYFERFFRELGVGDSIGMYHRDGVMLARYPYDAENIGENYSAMSLFRTHLPAAAEGSFRIVSRFDNVPRLLSYHTLDSFPVVVTVALSEYSLLEGWRRIVAVTAGALTLLSMLVALLAGLWAQRQRERERVLERHIQIEKLEALGRMTGGIVHDFNNLMASVASGLALIRHRVERQDIRQIADMATMAVDHCTKLTQQMLAFARRQELKVSPADVNDLIGQIETLLRNAAGSRIELTIDFGPDVPVCLTDQTQFDTALLNLVVNARDAMPSGGTIRISTSRCEEDDVHRTATLKRGVYACVSVTDNGHGMPPHILRRALDPFFTTKGDRGTGLGLSHVYGFLRQLGGDVLIESAVDEGTTVRLFFPAVNDENLPPGDREREHDPSRQAASIEA